LDARVDQILSNLFELQLEVVETRASNPRDVSGIAELVMSDLVAKKLAAHGVELSARQREGLAKQLLTNDGKFVHQPWKFWDRREISLEFTDADFEEPNRRAPALACEIRQCHADYGPTILLPSNLSSSRSRSETSAYPRSPSRQSNV
jgi:hypothetical protein